jgi:hypothetical protein
MVLDARTLIMDSHMAQAPHSTGTCSALSFLADEDLFPLEVGGIAVDLTAGRLRRADWPAPIPFGFSFCGHAFEAEARTDGGGVIVDCATVICRLPYSIEDRARRADLSRVLAALIGTGLRSELSHDQIVRVGLRVRFDSPATAERMVVALVEHLLPVKGWLELLAEIARRPKTVKARSEEPAVESVAVG